MEEEPGTEPEPETAFLGLRRRLLGERSVASWKGRRLLQQAPLQAPRPRQRCSDAWLLLSKLSREGRSLSISTLRLETAVVSS